MAQGAQEVIGALREAVVSAPENVVLRRHLAEALLKYGYGEAAETEYRVLLDAAPDEPAHRLGLARSFLAQSKAGQAVVLLEEVVKSAGAPAQARLLLARALERDGDAKRAAYQYRQAIEDEPDLADEELAERLGVARAPMLDEDDEDERIRQRVGGDWEPSESASAEVEIEKPRIGFDAVGGMEAVKEEIRLKIIYPLTHGDIYKAYGKKLGGGILLYGPPGCGKTHLARATAGEVGAQMIAVGISDVLNMYIGESESNLHAIFEQARSNGPCVLFFDEVDALGASRSDMRQSAGRHLVNQFLSEMDGMSSGNDGLLVLAATNAPWHVDAAFRRPGRFDRVIFVPPPDQPARAEIVRLLLQGKPAEDVDGVAIAKKTEGFSGADLKGLIDVAVESKLTDAMRTGKVQPLRTKDVLGAMKSVRPSTKEWFSTAKNHALYSNQGGMYDDVLDFLKLR